MTATDDRPYEQLMMLAALFDSSGADLRGRAGLGEQVLGDPAVADSAELAPATYARLDDAVRGATTGQHGLLTRSVELAADALIVRATVQTYLWIDELQEAAYRTLGSIAARAIGYLAPEVALGGAVVSAGLIETDALDRDGVAAYLDELAASNPELMDHVASGGGLLDGLQMRSLLTAGVPVGESWSAAARGGLRAAGAQAFPTDLGAALRDVAGEVVGQPSDVPVPATLPRERPRGLEDLIATLGATSEPVAVHEVAPHRYVAYLPGPQGNGARLRLVSGDHQGYADLVVRALEAAVGAGTEPARVTLVGAGHGGVTAVDIAALDGHDPFVVDQVVTVGAPPALVPRLPSGVHVLSLEDRRDPVAQLGALVNADTENRLAVVVDGDDYVAGARAADAATHPALRGELERLRELGYLASSSVE
ncbi:hypothetical protein [Nocardioides sp. SR21]|uniref:hypothetical protein n=1 Tax=Nocardioides sp. SR21 TaxID=2919501 RepID=UPI001FA99AC8|nr:hypothetical protein [Nocardioides sp. SR21]